MFYWLVNRLPDFCSGCFRSTKINHMKKFCYTVIIASAIGAALTSCGPKKSTDSENSSANVDSTKLKEEAGMMTSKHDESFAEKAAEAGTLEITLGKVAL